MEHFKTGNFADSTNATFVSLWGYHGNISTPHTGLYQLGVDTTTSANAYSAGSGTAFWITSIKISTGATSGSQAMSMGYNTSAITINTATAPAGTDTTVIGDVNGASSVLGKNGFITNCVTSTTGPWEEPQDVYMGPPFEFVPSAAGVVYPYISMYVSVATNWNFFIEGYEV